jgi:hypothetical protein
VKKALTAVGFVVGAGAAVLLLNLIVLGGVSALVAWAVMLLLSLFDVSVGFLVTWAATTLVLSLARFVKGWVGSR